MIRAYDEIYVNDAKNSLSQMFDYLINDCGFEPALAARIFVTSGYASMFENGNPAIISGMSGIELGQAVFRSVYKEKEFPEALVRLYPTQEYWAGWALAEYQWVSARVFKDIFERVPLADVLDMYSVYHEMDISRFIEEMDRRCRKALPVTRLKSARLSRGLSQSKLAKQSGVGLRSIQLYEQRVNDIDKAQVHTVYKLARAIGCSVEDLLEQPILT